MPEDIRIGVDIGAVTIGLAVLKDGVLLSKSYRFHRGEIRKALKDIFQSLDFSRARLALTGRGAKAIDAKRRINDIVAAVEGVKWAARRTPRYILLAGGENISLIKLDEDGSYGSHEVNTDCASGTGVFLDQQASRLGLGIEMLSELASRFEGSPPPIATRCAVFAKTDLIHSQQKGYSPAAIAAGLCDGVSLCLADNLIKDRDFDGDICMAGGVALNNRVVSALEKILHKKIDPLPHAEVIPAIGAALQAEESVVIQDFFAGNDLIFEENLPLNPPLLLEKSAYPDFEVDETWWEQDVEVTRYEELKEGASYDVYLGIDVGSTSTKLALVKEEKVLLGLYTYTQSAPVQAVQRLFKTLAGLEARFRVRFRFLAVGTTGSGRQLVGKLIRADLILNEITAHAQAAASLDPAVDTIIEIGGQDSKFIRVQRGAVVQAIMNYICAAGTGSFIEEQARKLNVSLQDYADQAIGKRGPVISDRCTVYMERDLSRLVAEGWPKDELLASVLHSVRDNYLMRVVGQAKMGKNICFQGATARNKALVASFEVALQRPIRVSRFCHLAGALGVCLFLSKRAKEKTDFVGLNFSTWQQNQRTETCSLCRNRCQITVVEVGRERAAWGFLCGREYEDQEYKERLLPFESVSHIYRRALPARKNRPSSLLRRKATIGIPRALPLVEYLPLWEEFFSRLGFRVMVSPQEKEILQNGKSLAQAEFCAPIVLAHGHAGWLAEKSADFIFFPIMLHGPRQQKEEEHNYFCYYTSYTPVVLHNSPLFEARDRLLFPLINLQDGRDRIARSLYLSLGRPLRLSQKAIRKAFEESWAYFLLWKLNLRRQGEAVLAELGKKDTFAVVLLGRPYNILDRTLNHNIPDLIQQSGYRVLTQDMLPVDTVTPRYTGDVLSKVHWHYGKKIVHATELIIRHAQLFPVYLTNFRCSPDAFIGNYFKELMERQGKPYLIIQLDELSSDVGYQTRVEAALESFRNWARREPQKGRSFAYLPLRPDKTWIVPYLDDAVTVLATATLQRFGYQAVVSEETPASIVQGLKLVGGGECVPVAALVGGIVETVKTHGLDPDKTAALIPTSVQSCNFPQIPLAIQSGLKKAGLEELKIFTTGVAHRQFPIPLNLALIKTYIMASLLHRLTARTRPYETLPGETEKVKARSLEKLSGAVMAKKNLLISFQDVVNDFASIKISRGNGARPLLVILGDLYVVCNSAFNQDVEKAVERAGGEALPSSFVDIGYFDYLNTIEKSRKNKAYSNLAKAKAFYSFVRFHDLKFRKIASSVLGGVHPLLDERHIRQLRQMGIPPELDGETAQNALEIFYYLQHIKPDGFVHINPLYCCPGVVSSALFNWVAKNFGVPVIHLFYDGIHSPNENLEPYLYYLQKKKFARDSGLSMEKEEGKY